MKRHAHCNNGQAQDRPVVSPLHRVNPPSLQGVDRQTRHRWRNRFGLRLVPKEKAEPIFPEPKPPFRVTICCINRHV